uniref:Aminotransferase class I/classII domain-containing protein n=1 Tax=Ditylenchus dipsaci TaxID=166011 RepID=A0A915DKK4_9BILA
MNILSTIAKMKLFIRLFELVILCSLICQVYSTPFLSKSNSNTFGFNRLSVIKNRQAKVWATIPKTRLANATRLPVLEWMIETKQIVPNPNKEQIYFAIGDPTLNGQMVNDESVQAVVDAVNSHKYDGYNSPSGILSAREAVAKRIFEDGGEPTTADDIILTLGGSHALWLAILGLADPGDNILISKPSFPYYKAAILTPNEIEAREYSIDLETREIDLLPIITDEIYQKVVYDGVFVPLAKLAPKVPILMCDGLSKRIHVPGWRLGWLVIYDRYDVLAEVKENVDQSYSNLSQTKGIKPYKPEAAMYMLVQIDDELISMDDIEFCKQMIAEQSLYLLPGSFFGAPNHFRMLMNRKKEQTLEAVDRIVEFVNNVLTPVTLPPMNLMVEENPDNIYLFGPEHQKAVHKAPYVAVN